MIKIIKNNFEIFCCGVMYFTRLPITNIKYNKNAQNHALRYFTVIGIIVGFLSFLSFFIAHLILPINISVMLAILFAVCITGAMHEDGLADFADSIGGQNREQVLQIMQDSRIGVFGSIALILMFILKISTLYSICEIILANYEAKIRFLSTPLLKLMLIFITYHALARLVATNIVFSLNYARTEGISKSKPIINEINIWEITYSYLGGLLPLLFFIVFFGFKYMLITAPLMLLFILMRKYFIVRINGYTGDCLGAIEQVSEVVILITFLIILNN